MRGDIQAFVCFSVVMFLVWMNGLSGVVDRRFATVVSYRWTRRFVTVEGRAALILGFISLGSALVFLIGVGVSLSIPADEQINPIIGYGMVGSLLAALLTLFAGEVAARLQGK